MSSLLLGEEECGLKVFEISRRTEIFCGSVSMGLITLEASTLSFGLNSSCQRYEQSFDSLLKLFNFCVANRSSVAEDFVIRLKLADGCIRYYFCDRI